jgi:uncharacterized protein (TIGR03435 family)
VDSAIRSWDESGRRRQADTDRGKIFQELSDDCHSKEDERRTTFMHSARLAACAVIVLISIEGAAATAPEFEVASVRPNVIGLSGGELAPKEKVTVGSTTMILTNVRLSRCITEAWGIADYQFSAPAWTGSERFDIVAKTAAPATEAEMRAMLQLLLTERFHLKLHRARKDLPVYALLPAKNGPKAIRESKVPGTPGFGIGDGAFHFHNVSMRDFSDELSHPPFNVDRPVQDRTGLSGNYDFNLKIATGSNEMKRSVESMQSGADDAPSVFTLLQEQLGLKLEARKAPVEVLVIDSADRIPAEN